MSIIESRPKLGQEQIILIHLPERLNSGFVTKCPFGLSMLVTDGYKIKWGRKKCKNAFRVKIRKNFISSQKSNNFGSDMFIFSGIFMSTISQVLFSNSLQIVRLKLKFNDTASF